MNIARGTLIRETRKAKGLSQLALAVAAGTTQGTISKIEKGDLVPRADLLAAIREALDLDAAAVL